MQRLHEVVDAVARPTVAEMAARGTPFAGLLYIGLAYTAAGPRVIEFNARFGDPETQVVLPLLETPLGGLLQAAATGRLGAHPPLVWRDESAVAVVLAAAGYPDTPRTGDVVTGADDHGVVHAGNPPPRRRRDGEQRRPGARRDGRRPARWPRRGTRPTSCCGTSSSTGGHYRTDIALAAADDRITLP